MKYGIEQSDNLIFKCANCGEVVANNGELKKNYCENCGAPLTPTAIADYEDNKEKSIGNVIKFLKEIAVENQTDSFSSILKVYEEE